jgi:hypothetical protein
MSSWQYAQLTISVDGRAPEPGSRTILWHGPGQGLGENYSDSGQTVLELLNRFGADGWELADLQDYREGGDGSNYWEAAQLLTVTPSSVQSRQRLVVDDPESVRGGVCHHNRPPS